MRLRTFAFLLGLLSLTVCARGQVVDLDRDHVSVTELNDPWRFHAGDDAAWAVPGFDDSGWSLLTADKPWTEQGYKGYAGTAWYRLSVVLPARHGALALYLPRVTNSFQVFANGRLIGQQGELPPHPRVVIQSRVLLPIPDDLAVPGRKMLLAIRVWSDPNLPAFSRGGIYPAPRIGDAQAIGEWRKLEGRQLYWQNSGSLFEAFGNLLPALASLWLFALRRKEREYLWFGIDLLVWSVLHFVEVYANFRPIPLIPFAIIYSSLLGVGFCLLLEFYVALLRQRRGWLYGAGMLFAVLIASGFLAGILFGFSPGWAASGLGLLLLAGCIAAMLYRAVRGGSSDAKVLLVVAGSQLALQIVGVLGVLPYISGLPWIQAVTAFLQTGIRWPFPLDFTSLLGDMGNIAFLVVLLMRYARTSQREERMEAELEAARTVQQVLIPAELPPVQGFAITSVYKPASQVGGDFFQIIPLPAGGVLVVVGDVSGKGMPAAMTVSLLVGTLRTLAHFTERPGEILAAMNQRMLARSAGGFTTCLVLRADAGGAITVANAGHLAPYYGHAELALQNGLPLGLDASAAYAESTFHLADGEQLTLLTDGVVEARSKDGELFGFARASAAANGSAESIAQAAQSFGQEDDITVLTITRIGLREEAIVQLAAPVPSPALA
jgi:hypothetical protein